jgi:CBS domain-containing protein
MDAKHPFIYSDEQATKARALIRDLNLRILPVTDSNKKLLGKASRRDVMTISSSKSPILVKGIMTPAKHTAAVEDDMTSTIKAMIKVDVWVSPVVASPQESMYQGVLGLESFIEKQIETNPDRFTKDVSDIMTSEVVTCSPDDEIEHIWRLMRERRLAGLPVVRDNCLVGIVTVKDLLERGATLPAFESTKGRYLSSPRISSLMTTNIVAVEPTVKAIRVAKVMVSKDIGRVPVKDKKGKLVGIVDREDIAKLAIR